MAKFIRCDLCGEEHDEDWPSFEVLVPTLLITQDEDQLLDVCGPGCLHQLAKMFEPRSESKPTRKLHRVDPDDAPRSNGYGPRSDEDEPPTLEFNVADVEMRS